MKNKVIIIVSGEPHSVFLEIFFKSLKYKSYKSPILLITSKKLLKFQMKKFKFNKKINLIDLKNFSENDLDKKSINLINVEYSNNSKSKKNLNDTNSFIKNCFDVGFDLVKKNKSYKFINGPIVKNKFLKKKFPGMTEYIANNFNIKKFAMMIYNKDLSVCPITTHIPLKNVSKIITKKKIYEKVNLVDQFFKKYKGKRAKIAILGLNPHCESIDKLNEDEKIIKPAVKQLSKKGVKISGPYSADTMFLKKIEINLMLLLGCITTRF